MDAPTGQPVTGPAEPDVHAAGGHRSGLTKVGIGFLVLLVVLGGIGAATLAWVNHQLDDRVARVPGAFDIPEGDRPPTSSSTGRPVNILLGGSDMRVDTPANGSKPAGRDSWTSGAARTDTIMLLHVSGDRKSVDVMSIPRDAWVVIPGHGMNKINAAYSFGGPRLFVRTVEQLTKVRIDHLALIDWEGFRALTDAVGGVDMVFPQAVRGISGKRYGPGRVTLNGGQALDYVRERKSLPGGDFDRQKRQQNFLRALMSKALGAGTLGNPVALSRVLRTLTNNLTVDDGFSTASMRELAASLGDVDRNDVVFLSVPNDGTGFEGSQSVVYLDQRRCTLLFAALREDAVPRYVARNGADTLGASTH